MSEFVDPIKIIMALITEMKIVERLRAVVKIGRHYNLDDNYCLYCYNKCLLGSWQFTCNNCQGHVACGEYALPACWIDELFVEMYGDTSNTSICMTVSRWRST